MQTFFTSLYSVLISIFQSQHPADFGLYKTDLFSLVGWSTLGVALLLVLVFYYVFNSALRTGMFRTPHWAMTLALAAGWPSRAWDFDGLFVNDSAVLDWVADDGARRGDGAPVLVAHSTPGFAASRLVDPAAAGPELVAALRGMLGLGEPTWSRVQRWTFAKPVARPGSVCAATVGAPRRSRLPGCPARHWGGRWPSARSDRARATPDAAGW